MGLFSVVLTIVQSEFSMLLLVIVDQVMIKSTSLAIFEKLKVAFLLNYVTTLCTEMGGAVAS